VSEYCDCSLYPNNKQPRVNLKQTTGNSESPTESAVPPYAVTPRRTAYVPPSLGRSSPSNLSAGFGRSRRPESTASPSELTDAPSSPWWCRRAGRTGRGSPADGVWKGKVGCLFDEIQHLVEPPERLHMDVEAGPQRGRMPEHRGQSRASGSPVPGAEESHLLRAMRADVRPGISSESALCRNGPARRRISIWHSGAESESGVARDVYLQLEVLGAVLSERDGT
jgi:hypothetical protein